MNEIPNIDPNYFKEGDAKGEVLDPSQWFDKWGPDERDLTEEEKERLEEWAERNNSKFNLQ